MRMSTASPRPVFAAFHTVKASKVTQTVKASKVTQRSSRDSKAFSTTYGI